MIAIITEKPSVGQDIARVVGARKKLRGALTGNGYTVTWALGHLLTLAMPREYGYAKVTADDLPLLPDPFRLVVRQTGQRELTETAAARQLNIIGTIFKECDSIIVATDAGREGELIFRYIYEYLHCDKPFRRLWISSLTDEAIRKGLAELRDGHEFDGLYAAADCRAKADWLVGINASRSLALASGIGNNSLGRVQTPTLAMICTRYRESREFVSSEYWQLGITLRKGELLRKFRCDEVQTDEAKAEEMFSRITPDSKAVIGKVERRTVRQSPPLPYDLTELQKECNRLYGFSAVKTLDIAQSLYERKLISYPRTGSRHIPDDVLPLIPALLREILKRSEYASKRSLLDPDAVSTFCVDARKVTDHHALITTGIMALGMKEAEQRVYALIAERMLEAFAPVCEKESFVIEAGVEGMSFRSRSERITNPGWRALFDRSEDAGEDEISEDWKDASFEEGETVSVEAHNLGRFHTTPPPLYTEATLLTAMETAGKHVEDEETRGAMKETGIGTPATRAGIIATLLQREDSTRRKKALVPTEKGLFIYDMVKGMRIADVELTGSWEKTLRQIECGKLLPESFMQAIGVFTRQVVGEVSTIVGPEQVAGGISCPRCGKGRISLRKKLARCDNEACSLVVFRSVLNKELTNRQLEKLLTSGSAGVVKGFRSKRGNIFDAEISFDADYNLIFTFPDERNNTVRNPCDEM